MRTLAKATDIVTRRVRRAVLKRWLPAATVFLLLQWTWGCAPLQDPSRGSLPQPPIQFSGAEIKAYEAAQERLRNWGYDGPPEVNHGIIDVDLPLHLGGLAVAFTNIDDESRGERVERCLFTTRQLPWTSSLGPWGIVRGTMRDAGDERDARQVQMLELEGVASFSVTRIVGPPEVFVPIAGTIASSRTEASWYWWPSSWGACLLRMMSKGGLPSYAPAVSWNGPIYRMERPDTVKVRAAPEVLHDAATVASRLYYWGGDELWGITSADQQMNVLLLVKGTTFLYGAYRFTVVSAADTLTLQAQAVDGTLRWR